MSNTEFIYYLTGILPLISIIYVLRKKLVLSSNVFFLLCVVYILHALGGVIIIGNTRLYDYVLFAIKYDFFMHTFSAFVYVLVAYPVLDFYLLKKTKKSLIVLWMILVILGFGIGTLAELNELSSVLFFNGAKGVGDYLNNAFDLVFNMLGALLGSLFIIWKLEKEENNQKFKYHPFLI